MTYPTFAASVLMYGAELTCKYADRQGVPGATLAKWLGRMSLRARTVKPAA